MAEALANCGFDITPPLDRHNCLIHDRDSKTDQIESRI
jgi:hypothetical protein